MKWLESHRLVDANDTLLAKIDQTDSGKYHPTVLDGARYLFPNHERGYKTLAGAKKWVTVKLVEVRLEQANKAWRPTEW